MEVLQKLTDLNWLLHLFLVLLPGSIFVTNISRINFPTGRYNSSFLMKTFQYVLVSLFFFAIFPVLNNLGIRTLVDPFFDWIGFPNAINLFPSQSKDWFAVLTEIFKVNANTKDVIFFVVIITLVSVLTSVIISLIIFLLDLEISLNFLSTYIIDSTKIYLPAIEDNWAKFNENTVRTVLSKNFYPTWGAIKKTALKILLIFLIFLSNVSRIIFSICSFLIYISLAIFTLVLHLISFMFFYITQFFHHPLYRYYCRGKLGRKHAICEARMDNILIKGRVRTFSPKSSSEISSLILDNIIKYTLTSPQSSFIRSNRESYIFPNPGSLISIPNENIIDVNIWHYDGSLGVDNKIETTSDIKSVTWYFKLYLAMMPFRSKEIIPHLSRLKINPSIGFIFWAEIAKIVIARYKRPWRFIYYYPQRELLLYVKGQLGTFVPLQLKPDAYKSLIKDIEDQSGIKI